MAGGEIEVSDHSDVLSSLIEVLITSNPDYNEGQKTVAKNTRVDAKLIVTAVYTFIGNIGVVDSNITTISIKINCPYPEAISESIEKAESVARDTVDKLFNYTDTWIIGTGADEAIERNRLYKNTFADLGLFI